MSAWTLGAAPLRTRFRESMDDPALHGKVARGTDVFRPNRTTAFNLVAGSGGETGDELRGVARSMRTELNTRLPELLERFADNVVDRGGHICWADNAAAANDYILAIIERVSSSRPGAAVRVVKGKSMVTEETELNAALAERGAQVVETDLGEWIIQLNGQTPSHIIAPALHLDRYDIAKIFDDKAAAGGIEPVPETMNAFARARLRDDFLNADIGITGCNLAVAETGTVLLVENEGNGRLSSTLPKIHIAVMGMERIVETWDQADLMLNLLARSATGQALSVYTNMITGPRRDGELDGPDELHVVILDNGRSALLGTEFHEMLNCIRCGACLNVCPVYRQTGGHAYGWVYSGPMGAVLTPLLHGDAPNAAELANASTLCGACMDACPVGIPLQDLLLALRRRKAAHAGFAEKLAWRSWALAWSSPRRYSASARATTTLGHRVVPRASWAPGAKRWTAGRSAPVPASHSFRDIWKEGLTEGDAATHTGGRR